MSLTRRRMIGTAASVTAAGLLEGQQSREEPSVLKGTTSNGKVALPPLQAATQLGGAPPNPEPVGRRSGVAVVGLGHLSLEQILPGFGQAERVRVTALVSGDLRKANSIGLQYGIPKTHIYDYQHFDRIKENRDVDIVYIVLPNSLHAEYTVRAAQAGKHVLCDQPMATSVADAQRMIDACAQAKRRLMIAYPLQYNWSTEQSLRWPGKSPSGVFN